MVEFSNFAIGQVLFQLLIWSAHMTLAERLQVPECTTSRSVQAVDWYKWEHLEVEGLSQKIS